mgnify:CR=1 FL=1
MRPSKGHACASVVSYAASRYEDAVRHGDRALELHPDFAMALYLTAFSLCQLGRFDAAIERLERLAAVGGRHPIFVGLLGYGYGAAGRRERQLPAPLQVLKPHELEDVLCIHKGQLTAGAWLRAVSILTKPTEKYIVRID